MLVIVNDFDKVSSTWYRARTRRRGTMIFNFIPKNLEIRKVLAKRVITLFDVVEVTQYIREVEIVSLGKSFSEIIP